jgi:hypothetical protein
MATKKDGRSSVTITIETDLNHIDALSDCIHNAIDAGLDDAICYDGRDYGKYKVSAKKGANVLWSQEAPEQEFYVVVYFRTNAISTDEAEEKVMSLISGGDYDISESYVN